MREKEIGLLVAQRLGEAQAFVDSPGVARLGNRTRFGHFPMDARFFELDKLNAEATVQIWIAGRVVIEYRLTHDGPFE